eukprot:g730.t1
MPGAIAARRALVCCAVIAGVLNNASFCVLLGAGQQIASDFGKVNEVSLITCMSTVGCLLGIFLNAKLCVGVCTERTRLLMLLCFVATGYSLVILAYATCYHGGEGQILNAEAAVDEGARPLLLSTGLSGIFGPLLYLFLTGACGLNAGETAIVLLASLPLYLACFWLIVGKRDRGLAVENALLDRGTLFAEFDDVAPTSAGGATTTGSSRRAQAAATTMPPPRLSSKPELVPDQAKSAVPLGAAANDPGSSRGASAIASNSAPLTYANFVLVLGKCKLVIFNMVAVYSLEYLIISGFVDRVTLCPTNRSFLATHAYTIYWALYNVGVTLSRASVAYFRIQKVYILTLLQLLNAVLWCSEPEQQQGHVLASTPSSYGYANLGYYIMGLHVVFIGFMGGACYSNCMYLFNTSPCIPSEYRELGLNIGFLFSNVGIISATALTLLLDATAMSKETLFPPHGVCPRGGTLTGGGAIMTEVPLVRVGECTQLESVGARPACSI